MAKHLSQTKRCLQGDAEALKHWLGLGELGKLIEIRHQDVFRDIRVVIPNQLSTGKKF